MEEAWERAVEAASGGEDYESVRSLTLDGAVKCSQGRLPDSSLLEQFSQLRLLSIANVGLASLADFPSLPHLERLVLSDNRISGGLEALVEAGLLCLRDLDLSNNKIQNIEDLYPLAKLNLLSLDLYECPVTRMPDYRAKVFSSIKSLQYLDKVDVEDNERPESEEEDEDEDEDEEDDDDGDGDEDEDEDAVDTDDLQPIGFQKPGIIGNNFHAIVEDEDGTEDDEESYEIDEEEDGATHGNGIANHLGQVHDNSGTDDDEDDDVDDSDDDDVDDDEEGEEVTYGDAVEVHDIEETDDGENDVADGDEEDEDEDDVDDDDDDDDEDDEDDEQLARSLEGEIVAQQEADDDENGEIGEDDVVIEDDGEDDNDRFYGSEHLAGVEDEEGSDVDLGDDYDSEDDDDDDGNGDDVSGIPSLKRKRSKDESSDVDASDDERHPKR
ncbi:hypothetical protein KP509_38G018300 [Ceratopteris richardii]|uniref:Acidic leucine-rich nuclear phosphoprotein 32-related protein n=1 Tax=Ceratopteris richardii TaxID=49495 RepID=A0A8T2Q278_CERRI|nr:hypothetical protein KP509_38G018300 [Ceratopteris richardii]